MAIQLNNVVIEHRKEMALSAAVSIPLERGMIMAEIVENGQLVVAPCTGGAGERVIGVLWDSLTEQSDVPTVESVVVPAAPGPFTVSLSQIALAGTDLLVRLDTGAALVGGGVDYTLAGSLITFNAALAGKAVSCTYRFAISAQELQRRGGRRSINNGPEGLFSRVTIGYGQCSVLLSNFDTSEAYAPLDQLLTAANGRCTTAAGGTIFATCTASPSINLTPGIEQLFIGLEFNTPLAP
jgi:hypothetical protein